MNEKVAITVIAICCLAGVVLLSVLFALLILQKVKKNRIRLLVDIDDKDQEDE